MIEIIESTFLSTFGWEWKRKLSLSVLRRADMREHTNVKWPTFLVCVCVCVCVCNCTSIIWREGEVRPEVGGEGVTSGGP